jgi:hypothetical protein
VKVLRYSQRLVDQYDQDEDGRLSESEWSQMRGSPQTADANRDGQITVSELADQIARYGRRRKIRLMPALSAGAIRLPSLLSPAAESGQSDAAGRPEARAGVEGPQSEVGPISAPRSIGQRRDLKFTVSGDRLPRGLPVSFLSRDRDGDAQLTMMEFAPEASPSAVRDFAKYDSNNDGVITPEEYLRVSRRRPAARTAAAEAELEEAESEEASGQAGTEGPAELETENGAGETARPARTRLPKAKAGASPLTSAEQAKEAGNVPPVSSKSAIKAKKNKSKKSKRD